jgi:hypothetical protein
VLSDGTRFVRGKPTRAAGLVGGTLVALGLVAAGCALQNPRWAASTNPCCGQDLALKGIVPPEDRCADIVVDQETAYQLMMSLSGSAAAQWHVRLIPGGPACIWRVWPDVRREDFDLVAPPGDSGAAKAEPAPGDTGREPQDR